MVGVENATTMTNTLIHAKENLNIIPEIIVHDLSPNILAAVKNVFSEDHSAIDPFHVMQELNRAIMKDLSRYQRKIYSDRINKLTNLRDMVTKYQKQKITFGEWESQLNEDDFRDELDINILLCCSITSELLQTLEIQDNLIFFEILRQNINYYKQDYHPEVIQLAIQLESKLPKRTTSDKACIRVKSEVLRKLKSFYLGFRKPITKEKIRFNKQRYVLFYQPENLTEKRIEILNEFLSDHPNLNQYRDLTLHVGSIYRLPQNQIHNELIADIHISSKWGDKLKACMKTFKKNVKAILRFREFFENHPELPKRCRANMEYSNPRVKQIFRSGKNLKSMNRIQNELKLQIGGEVRNLLSA